MIIVIGLVILIAAVIIGVAGVAANIGEVRTSTSDFAVFDYTFSASAGELFLWGMVVGAIGMLGLSLLLAGSWRSARRNSMTRRELKQSRKEMAAARRAAPPAKTAPSGTPPAGTAPPPPPGVEPSVPPQANQPSGKAVWSWNRFMRQPSGATPVEKSDRTTAQTTK